MELNWCNLYYIVIFAPVLLGMILGYIFKIDYKKISSAQNSPKFFMTIWMILFLFYGVSWVLSASYTTPDIFFLSEDNLIIIIHTLYSICLVLILSWFPLYSLGYKKAALCIILISLTLTLMIYGVGNMMTNLLISPLIVWLFFIFIKM